MTKLTWCVSKLIRFESEIVFLDAEAVLIEIVRHFGWYLDSGKAE